MSVKDIFVDKNGKQSSKRVWASIFLGASLIMSVVLFIYSLYKGAADAATALAIINALAIPGASILGISTFEIKNKSKKEESKLLTEDE